MKEHLQTLISVNFHHTSSYPPCTHSAVSHFYTDDVGYSFHEQIHCSVSCWFSKTSSSTCAVFTCPWSAGLRGQSSWLMSAHFWTPYPFSLHNVVSVNHHHTPELTGHEFNGWKCCAYVHAGTNVCVTMLCSNFFTFSLWSDWIMSVA